MQMDETPIGKLMHAYNIDYDVIWLEHKSTSPRIYYPNGSTILFLEEIPPSRSRNEIPIYCEVLLGDQKGRIMINRLKFSYPEKN
jgi:hypothetical protein